MPSAFPRSSTTTVLFLTDLHLDRIGEDESDQLLRRIRNADFDSVIATGDISNAKNIRRHLSELATACAPRPLYFLTGNHDYHGGGFRDVEEDVDDLCKSTKNLHHLDGKRVVKLADGIGLLGHRGWPDARAGDGMETEITNPDRWSIKDFRAMDHRQTLQRMRHLGKESAGRLRNLLPLALTRFRHVLVATHVPPFDNAVYHKGKPADCQHLPHFCNLSVGLMLIGILRAFPRRRVSVLAGHSHGACSRKITGNLVVRVGASRKGGRIPLELIRIVS